MLIAWYPLNGDLKDYSGNNRNLTINSGAVVDNSGKTGKCYSFDGVDDYLSLPAESNIFLPYDNSPFSISIWFNLASLPAAGNRYDLWTFGETSSHNWNACEIYQLGGGSLSFCNYGNDAGMIYEAFILNKWYNFIITYDGTILKQYLNGVLKTTQTFGNFQITKGTQLSIGRDWSRNISYHKGKINDFRIYDHALSEKEIFEIKKAKILHYSFNDYQEPTINMYPQVKSNNEFGIIGQGVFTVDTYTDNEVIYKYDYSQSLPSTWHGHDIVVDTTLKYTYSMDVFISLDCNASGASRFVANCEGGLPVSFHYDLSKKGTWQHLEHTATPKSSPARPLLYPTIYNETGFPTTGYVLYKNVNFEAKDHSTPFVNGSRKGMIRDCSGYRNDATLNISTTPQWIPESKIGKGAYKFNGSQSVSIINPFKDNNLVNELTISGWMKKSANNETGNHLISLCGNDFIRIALDKGGSGVWVYCSMLTSTAETVSQVVLAYLTPASFVIGSWYHIAVTFNNGVFKLYVNGISVATSNFVGNLLISKSNNGFLGSFGGSNEYAYGTIDDIQVYATALTDTDIQSLYNTKASIDNAGNLYLSNVTETASGSGSVTEKSQLLTNKISEVGITEGLAGWWSLIKNTKDISGNKADSTVVGATQSNGPKGGSYLIGSASLNHINTPINMPTFIANNNGYTLSIFAKLSGTICASNEGVIFGSDGFNWGILATFVSGTNWLIRAAQWGDDGTTKTSYNITAPITVNTWNHIVITFDKATKLLKLYINGVYKNQVTVVKPLYYSKSPLIFGSSGANWWVDASIYDARLYNRALTNEEIGILYEVTNEVKAAKFTNDCVYLGGRLKEV